MTDAEIKKLNDNFIKELADTTSVASLATIKVANPVAKYTRIKMAEAPIHTASLNLLFGLGTVDDLKKATEQYHIDMAKIEQDYQDNQPKTESNE
jgi:hypothetical protein